ncbi:fibronectin type III domain-containing protein [Pontibacillus salipaludis]|uniref:fibronectin type III domain-containing protein n=1 Tax=Pontibacillus salipaludis TaxID=1697394 RepID=UPI0016670F0A|nr:fibronectin type III domain-containing protein [Pontibacillus salipaludis]
MGRQLPNAPSGLTESNLTDTSLSLTWSEVSYDEGIQHYEVYRDGTFMDIRVGTSFADSGLTPETPYSYQVVAVGENGVKSAMSEPLEVTTLASA